QAASASGSSMKLHRIRRGEIKVMPVIPTTVPSGYRGAYSVRKCFVIKEPNGNYLHLNQEIYCFTGIKKPAAAGFYTARKPISRFSGPVRHGRNAGTYLPERSV